MADPSFDVVSKVDGQEVDNALNDKLVKRGVSVKSLEVDEPAASGKKRDDPQVVITLAQGHDFGVAVRFINYR